MRFAARESELFAQPEAGFGLTPGAGTAQHLTRLMGRGRALEALLSAENYDAQRAERYGWINRALPAAALGDFVNSLARRIARFPTVGLAVIKERINAVALAPAEDFRRDSRLFVDGVRNPEAQNRIKAAMKRGSDTREAEMAMARILGDFATTFNNNAEPR
jgi:enoyl-CoA hydratase/carnithine racemase